MVFDGKKYNKGVEDEKKKKNDEHFIGEDLLFVIDLTKFVKTK